MVFKNKTLNKFWRFSCSFQLGIPILVFIAGLISWGTIVESRFDAQTAKKLVYDSWMMWTVMSLLVYNLVVVVVDRWPWQSRHYPFIVVHAGIVILVLGGYITARFGLDGSMPVPINGRNNAVAVANTDVVVYATFDGDKYTKVFDREVDFFSHPPTEQNPYVVDVGVDQIKILDYAKYAVLNSKVKSTDEVGAGSSVRFQLMNTRVKQVEQITQQKKDRTASFNFGPAKVHLGTVPESRESANEVYLTPLNEDTLQYTVFHRESAKPFKAGKMKIGDVVSTGWMGLELRLLDYLPKAAEVYEVIKKERPNDGTTSAVLIQHREAKRWIALNDVVKLFADSGAFLMSYQNRRINVGFEIKLDEFSIKRYQGIAKAMSYESRVQITAGADSASGTISMNEPMKFNGFTIYQASFQQDPSSGEPVASIFSINQDPGRPTKYLGSILLSVGIVWLFYQRRKKATAI